jgi:cation diffusion facilitator family transporter
MHTHSLDQWTHDHVFVGSRHERNERRTWAVVTLTAVMMIGEIAGGHLFGSLALVADGWHMSTHAAALAIAALAYRYARSHRNDPRFTFGTGKLGELAAFTSAILLAVVALAIAYECAVRLSSPIVIYYGEAIAIATLGLGVNIVSASLLRDDHHHHSAGHDAHDHGHHDSNLRAAYVHVLADAATSVAAIAGLGLAWRFGWAWIDPVVGLIGACVIVSWAFRLIRDCGAVLLDTVPDQNLKSLIRSRLEIKDDRVSDLHLWRVGPGHHAAVISIVTDNPNPPAIYKKRLAGLRGLSHLTIEVDHCTGH